MDAFREFRDFVECLQAAEYSVSDGCPLHLTVKYRADDAEYWGWPLPRGNHVTATALLDPGFGSGPTNFSDIERVSVHSAPRGQAASAEYESKYVHFVESVRKLRNATVLLSCVTFEVSEG